MSLENVRQTDRKRDKNRDRGKAGRQLGRHANGSVFLVLRPVPCKGLMTFMHNRRRPLRCSVLLVLWAAMSCTDSVRCIVTCQKITIFSHSFVATKIR
jgi:hypothetical protein